MAENNIPEIKICCDNENIFGDYSFVIPLYQRPYAWEDEEIGKLIEDIWDFSDSGSGNYYLGSLIVHKRDNSENEYEIIDGQQRLTTLYLLLNYLDIKVDKNLSFDCRERSNYTLKNIGAIAENNIDTLDREKCEENIINGYSAISSQFGRLVGQDNKNEFIKKLSRVILYLIEVPEHTDLNRYFEIMNTRGEQLEQTDTLKGALMSYLDNNNDRLAFAEIWNACSDMTGYVQMHFKSDKNTLRAFLFGSYWNDLNTLGDEALLDGITARIKSNNNQDNSKKSIEDIICEANDKSKKSPSVDDEGDRTRIRYESIIDFSYFLLHTLNVYASANKIKNGCGESISISLDDKRLLKTFDDFVEQGVQDKAEFSRSFIIYLLKTRFVFDKYIIKREFVNAASDGEWSIKSLCSAGQGGNKKPIYEKTYFIKYKNDKHNKRCLMLQSALRVSYTSPKAMHWITKLLCWLYNDENVKNNLGSFDKYIEAFMQTEVNKNYLALNRSMAMGVDTPHIVFNYLDFLLWDRECKKYGDFQFEFRNSVEHWYPQHPSEGTFEKWLSEDGVDRLGNLCLVQRSINSKFSNMSPEAKKSTFEDMIKKGSLKLRIMAEKTGPSNDKSANYNWRDTVCEEHENEMIKLLRSACEY